MCGRFTITHSNAALAAQFGAVPRNDLPESPRFIICPTQDVAVVTSEGGPGVAGIHHREPVILEPADWPLWLGEAGQGAAALMKTAPEGVLSVCRVDQAVNSNRASGAQLIAPIAA